MSTILKCVGMFVEDIQNYIKKPKVERKRHIDLDSSCCIRGGDSIQFRGLLAHYLDTNIPSGHTAQCCHACNNPDCSNPKHLYWGTPSENRQDRLELESVSGLRDDNAKKESDRVSGNKNPNYGKMPWDNVKGNKESWLKGGMLYDALVLEGWDFSQYGKGSSYLQRVYGLAQGSSKVMIKMFRRGWIPWEDVQWVDFYNTYKS